MATPTANAAASTQPADLTSLPTEPTTLESAASPQAPAPLSLESAPLPLESQDPRVRRTRQLLQQALAHLLTTREFEKLSVQEITDAAGVNRATFYAHYPDKFALLECMVASRFHALLDERGIVFNGTCTSAIQGIVLGVCDFLAQTVPLPCATSPDYPQNQMAPHMESAIVAVVRAMLLDGIQRHPPASGRGGVRPRPQSDDHEPDAIGARGSYLGSLADDRSDGGYDHNSRNRQRAMCQ